MRYILLILCSLFVFGYGLTGLQAQEAIPAAGGNASQNGQGSVSWSVGQVAYTTYTGTTGSLSQGVQQSFEISVVNAMKENTGINLMVSAFPNPAADRLILTAFNFEFADLTYQLFNNEGKLLESKTITAYETNIDMSHLLPAIYFLKVTEYREEVKTFRIIKN
ncbi:MAG: T9SS type A sorting domain-containing protein [Bacteroidales bacterium]|nr:T9SS type A sorting domain-containing protein [Bacteroidales bacterium]